MYHCPHVFAFDGCDLVIVQLKAREPVEQPPAEVEAEVEVETKTEVVEEVRALASRTTRVIHID